MSSRDAHGSHSVAKWPGLPRRFLQRLQPNIEKHQYGHRDHQGNDGGRVQPPVDEAIEIEPTLRMCVDARRKKPAGNVEPYEIEDLRKRDGTPLSRLHPHDALQQAEGGNAEGCNSRGES